MAMIDPNNKRFLGGRRLQAWSLMAACCWLLVSADLMAQEPAAAAAAQPDNQAVLSTTINPKYVMPELKDSDDRDTARQKRGEASAVRKLITNNKATVIDSLRKGDTSNGPLLDEFLNGFIFAEMGQNKTNSLSQLGDLRRNFFRSYLSDKVPAGTRKVVIEQYTLPKMVEFMDGNYHKGVRMNAVVLTGLLNDREGDSRNVPVPSKAAFNQLSKVFTDAKYPSYLKVGALAGLQRHFTTNRRLATSQISAAEQAPITNQCVAIIQDKADGQDTWPESLNYWLKRRSTQVLGAIGDVGTDGANAKAISTNLYNEDNPNLIRFDSLVALSQMKFDPALAPEVGTKVIEFVAHFLENEAKALNNGVDDLITINLLYEDKDLVLEGSATRTQGRDAPNAGMGFGEDEGPGSGGSKEDDGPTVDLPVYKLNDSRKRVKAVVYTALQFFENDRNEGLVQIVADDKKANFRSAMEILDRLITESDIGIVDLSKLEEGDDAEEQKDITKQLVDIYSQGADELDALVVRAAPPKPGLEAITGDEAGEADATQKAEAPPENGDQNGAGGN
ncbi:MAG: hypothetical protein MK108_08645 [Mariniblastus sp.]|nr:hypothetical protein [Mariniblastus sp.]